MSRPLPPPAAPAPSGGSARSCVAAVVVAAAHPDPLRQRRWQRRRRLRQPDQRPAGLGRPGPPAGRRRAHRHRPELVGPHGRRPARCRTPPTWPPASAQPWTKLGENVGTGPSNDPIWNAFVNSAHHYANIVDPDFNRVGVGVAYVVQRHAVDHPALHAGRWRIRRRWRRRRWRRRVELDASQVEHAQGQGQPLDRRRPPPPRPPPPAPVPTPPPPQPGPPPPADSARVAAVLTALHHLST